MAKTYDLIQRTTLSAAASTITFSSIPSTYTDLRAVFFVRPSGNNNPGIRFNGDTGTNYSRTTLEGTGATLSSSRQTSNGTLGLLGSVDLTSTNTPHLFTIDVFDYAGSAFKTVLATVSGDQNGSGGLGRLVGMWRSTSGISSINFVAFGNNWPSGSTATLYGITRGTL